MSKYNKNNISGKRLLHNYYRLEVKVCLGYKVEEKAGCNIALQRL